MIPGIKLWKVTIVADRHTASPEQQQDAWAEWCACPSRTGGALAAALSRAGAGNDDFSWRNARVADRMLQRARKAGVIRFEKGRWHLVEAEQEAAR